MFLKFFRFLLQPSGRNIGFGLASLPDHNILDPGSINRLFIRKPSRLRYTISDPVQMADPFLFKFAESLYCFFEYKSKTAPGKICGIEFRKNGAFVREFSCELGVNTHLSFPFVFSLLESGEIFMLPETVSLGEVALYKSVEFPVRWSKVQVLLTGNYVDSHCFEKDGIYYIFTTEKVKGHISHKYDYQFKIFFSDTLAGPYMPHPCNPVLHGRKYSRCGGSILFFNGKTFRIAQDCENSYGSDLHFFEIKELTPTNYREELCASNWISNHFRNNLGGHHISLVDVDSHPMMVVDFNFRDSYLQRFLDYFQR